MIFCFTGEQWWREVSEKFILGKLEEEYMSNFLPSVGICEDNQGYFVEVGTFSNVKWRFKLEVSHKKKR